MRQVYGTSSFGSTERFKDYKRNAFIRSNPAIGPGSHNAMENFKGLKNKKCRVVMTKQIFKSSESIAQELSRHSSGSRRSGGSNNSSSKGFATKFNDLHQGGRRSRSQSKSPKGGAQYVMSGNVLQPSPMKPDIDRRLNYMIYEQDSLAHRDHLLTLMNKKNLKGNKS